MLSIFDLAEVLAGFAAFFTLFFVLARRQRHISAHFYAGSVSASLIFWVSYLIIFRSRDVSLSNFEHGVLTASLAVTAAAGLLFLYTFARENPHQSIRNWMLPLYALNFLLLSAAVAGFFFHFFDIDRLETREWVISITSLGKYFLVLLFVAFAFGLQQLVNTVRASTGRIRRALLLPTTIIFLLLILLLVTLSLALLFSQVRMLAIQVSAVLATAAMIFTSRFLVFEELFGQRVVVSREAVYSSVGVLLAGAYLVLIGTAIKLLVSIGGSPKVFFSVLAAFVVIITFLGLLFSQSIKQRLRGFVDRSIYSGKLDLLSELTSFAEDVTAARDKKEMFRTAVVVLEQKCHLREVAIWLRTEEAGEFAQEYPEDDYRQVKLPVTEDWLFRSARLATPEEIRNAGTRLSDDENNLLAEIEDALIFPLVARKELVGFAVCYADDKPATDVKFLIDSISHQLALSILSAAQSEKLIETREMASFHKVSSFVAHDVKNLISMISMILQNAEKKFGEPRFQKVTIETLRSAQQRMQRMIRRLSSPHEEADIEITDCDLRRIILDLQQEMKLPTGSDGKLKFAISGIDHLPLVRGNDTKLKSVLRNLVINAIEAMPNGGELKITVETNEESVLVKVNDSGVGMTAEFVRNQLFKPFKTSKPGGLGIGMFQSRETTEQMGGTLSVTSEPGQGSVFSLKLRKA